MPNVLAPMKRLIAKIGQLSRAERGRQGGEALMKGRTEISAAQAVQGSAFLSEPQ